MYPIWAYGSDEPIKPAATCPEMSGGTRGDRLLSALNRARNFGSDSDRGILEPSRGEDQRW